MSSSCRMKCYTSCLKWKGGVCGVRELAAIPKAYFSPLPIVAFATEQQARILTLSKKVAKSIKVFCNLVDQYRRLYPEALRGCRNFLLTNAMRNEHPTWLICSLGKGGFEASYADAGWLRTRSNRHLRGMQQLKKRGLVPKSRPPHPPFSCQEYCTRLRILVLRLWGTNLHGPVSVRIFLFSKKSLPSRFSSLHPLRNSFTEYT
jgi:hypothetical protein